MKAVILAAGKGTRLGDLTRNTPKPMVPLNGRPMLDYVLRSLPAPISEVIMVIGYRGEAIRSFFGSRFLERPITYVEQGAMPGTAGALWSAREALGEGRFLVVQGDDMHLRSELEACVARPLAYGIHRMLPESRSVAVDTDAEGHPLGWHAPTPEETASGVFVTTGTYVLDHRIFRYPPEQLPNGEFGLPQTILAMSKDHPVRTVPMDHWLTVTYPQDIVTVEQALHHTPWHSQ